MEINIKKIKPLFNYVIITAEKYTAEELAEVNNGLIRADLIGELKPYQTVYAVGDRVTFVEPGQLVAVNLDRYAHPVQKKDTLKQSMDEYYNAKLEYHIPAVIIDGVEYLQIGDNDIKYIIQEYEFVEVKPDPVTGLIVPDKSLLV